MDGVSINASTDVSIEANASGRVRSYKFLEYRVIFVFLIKYCMFFLVFAAILSLRTNSAGVNSWVYLTPNDSRDAKWLESRCSSLLCFFCFCVVVGFCLRVKSAFFRCWVRAFWFLGYS